MTLDPKPPQPPTAEMPALEAPCAGWLRDRYEVGALWATRGPVSRFLGLDHAGPAGPLPVWVLRQEPAATDAQVRGDARRLAPRAAHRHARRPNPARRPVRSAAPPGPEALATARRPDQRPGTPGRLAVDRRPLRPVRLRSAALVAAPGP